MSGLRRYLGLLIGGFVVPLSACGSEDSGSGGATGGFPPLPGVTGGFGGVPVGTGGFVASGGTGGFAPGTGGFVPGTGGAVLTGGAGGAVLTGGAGGDIPLADASSDAPTGDASSDASVDASADASDASSDASDASSMGGTGGDLPTGGTGGDLPTGGTGGDLPTGGTGGDLPTGGTGGDLPTGGTGGDLPTGGTGGDLPTGGTGGDLPTGGTGGISDGGTSGGGGTPEAGSDAGAFDCTGKPGAPLNETRTYAAENLQYIVHRPANLDPNRAVPLLFVAHGYTMSGALMQTLTGFDAVANAEGFVVVYPNGHGANPWNVGLNVCAPGNFVNNPTADSFGYYEAMQAAIEEDQCIHPEQVFVTGFSMGGYFSNHMGCQRGNTFARAVGPHSGGTYIGNNCPGAPVPVFIMHGDADTFIHWDICGGGARDQWLVRNSCDSTFNELPVQGGSCDWYEGCDANGQTVYCLFNGVGHAWAAGATDAVWDFFKDYL